MDISIEVARRFILGKQGLWPGRRWRGLAGTEQAMHAIGDLQLDPLVVVARAHDLMLQGRVIGYQPDDWATLTYDRHRFFEWGGWLAVRPIEELPVWRVLMRRERDNPRMKRIVNEHGPAVDEMRAVLRERGTVSNRDFEMASRKAVTSYRGRKDSALALHYLWRIGEAMVIRRERFERLYALTEAVAPAALIRETDAAEADDFLLRKQIGTNGLSRLTGVASTLGRPVAKSEIAAWREGRLADDTIAEVRVDGWPGTYLALAADTPALEDLAAGRIPKAWTPLDTTTDEETTFLAPLEPVSARGRAKVVFDFDYVWEVYKPAATRRWGYYTLPILWGDRLVARFDSKLDRPTGTLVLNGLWLEDEALARDSAFREALGRGMDRFVRFLDAGRVDATAIARGALRNRLTRKRGATPPS
jgi:uncharacterized protein YcaQ